MGSLGRPNGRRVHPSSCGFTPARLWVVEFIRVRVGSLMACQGIVGIIPFRVGSRTHGCPVHPGSRWFNRAALGSSCSLVRLGSLHWHLAVVG